MVSKMNNSVDALSVFNGTDLPANPTVLLTPGRTRNIAQDMEALRLSRQDNPYLQQVMASRESLIDSHEDSESDDTNLMSQEFGSTALDLVEEDPLTLKEVHDHMIRSPPPTSSWPHEGMSVRASSAFDFTGDAALTHSVFSVYSHQDQSGLSRSPRRLSDDARATPRPRSAPRALSPRAKDFSLGRPLSLPGESHVRSVLSKRQSGGSDRFSLLGHGRSRGPGARYTAMCEDDVHLVSNK